MLRTMREDFKKYSWTLWLVIIAFLGGFAFTDMFSGKSRREGDLIFVGDTVIKAEDYQKQLLSTLQNYKRQFRDNFNKNLINQLRVPEQTLQQMVSTAILRQEAKKMNITVSPAELREKIKSFPGLQQDGKFVGFKAYRLTLSHARINVDEFETEIRNGVMVEKFKTLITAGMVIEDDQLKEKYKTEKDSADVDYIILRPDRVKDKPETTDEEIKTYYEANKDNFKSSEKRSGNVIVMKFDDFKKDITITDKELFDHFQANKEKFREPGKTKVSRILLKYDAKNRDAVLAKAEALQKELTKDNFAAKAKEVSQDDKAQNGGDHGYFAWNRFTKQETTIIDNLKEFEISTPVDTLTGFAILMLSEKKNEQQKEFDKVKPIIKSTIEKERLNALLSDKMAKIHKKVKGVDNIKEKADSLGVTVVDTGALGRGEGAKDLEDNGFISRQLFTLKDKEVSAPVSFPKGMAIVQLIKTDKPEVEPLEKVTEKVKAEVIRQKKVALVLKEAETLANEMNGLENEKAVEEFLKKNDLKADNVAYRRGDRLAHLPQKDGLDKTIFSMDENTYSPLALKNDAVIVKVKSKKLTTDDDFNKEKDDFYKQKLNELKSGYFNAYISNKREAYDVRINQELFLESKDHVVKRFN